MRHQKRTTLILAGLSALALLNTLGAPYWLHPDLDDTSAADESIASEWDGFNLWKFSFAGIAPSLDDTSEPLRVPFLAYCDIDPQEIVHTVVAVRSTAPRAPPVLS